MNNCNKINYWELPAKDLPASKVFFTQVFGWSVADYGPIMSPFQMPVLRGASLSQI